MAKECNVEILASKRLTKSFNQVDDYEVWSSISLSLSEAKDVIIHALDKMTNDSDPLTITISLTQKE